MGKYKPYPEYKDSGVEWLGDVPKGWDVYKIKHLSGVKRGASPRPIDDPKYFDIDGKYSWVRIADVTACNGVLNCTPQKLSELGSLLSVKLEPESLFLSIAGSVGKPCINQIPVCIHDGFVYFPLLKIPARFLYYVFEAGQAYKGLGKFGTQLNLNTDTVGDIKVAVPSLRQYQTQIVSFLDHETAKIDCLIEKQEKLIELLKEKRQAVISHAVTKGLNPDAPMKDSGVEWLGEVPEHWEVKSVKHLLERIEQGKSPECEARLADADEWGVVKSGCVNGGRFNPLEHKAYPRVTNADLSNDIRVGDVLMSRASGSVKLIGSVALVRELPYNLLLSDKIFRLVYDPKIVTGEFLTIVMGDLTIRKQIELAVNGAEGLANNITKESIRTFKLVLPTISEQRDTVSYLEKKIGTLEALISSGQNAISLLRERRTALISAAVTGKIDVRDWSEPEECT